MNMTEERTIRDFFTQEGSSIVIPKDFFKCPNPDTLLQMYYYLCDIIFGLNDHEFTDKTGQPSRVILVIKIYGYLNGLFTDILAGEAIFSYKDMLLPDIKRTRYFLVQLVKFYKFKCERQAEVDNVLSELEERRRDVETEKAFEQSIYSQLERERQNLEIQQKKKTELDSKQCALQREVKLLRETSEEQKNEFTNKGSKEKELAEKSTEVQLLITEAQEKSKRLDQNIVTSPDRMSNDIEAMEEELKTLNIKHAEAVKELKKLERDLSDQAISEQFLVHFNSELKQLESFQTTISEHRRLNDEGLQLLRAVEKRMRSAQQRFADQNSQNEANLRQLNDDCQQGKKKIDILVQEKINLETDLKTLTQRCTKTTQEFRQMQADLKQRTIELQLIGEKFDDAVAQLRFQEKSIEEKVNEEETIIKEIYQKAKILSEINEN